MWSKLIFCAMLQFVYPYTSTQIVVALIGHVFYSLFLAFNSPYKDPSDFLMSTLGDLEIFTVVFAALMLKVEIGDPDDQSNLDSLLVLAVSIPIMFFMMYTVYEFLGLCRVLSPSIGFEATRMMYPGVVFTYSEYALSSTKRIKATFMERQNRLKQSKAPDVQQHINDLWSTIRFHHTRDKYGKITLSIVESSWILVEKWTGRSDRLCWLRNVIDAYISVICSHDQGSVELKLLDLNSLLRQVLNRSSSTESGGEDNGDLNFARETLRVLKYCCGEEEQEGSTGGGGNDDEDDDDDCVESKTIRNEEEDQDEVDTKKKTSNEV